MSRREDAARRRAARSGSGPADERAGSGRFPGAVQGFALFGEVMLLGFLLTALALPIVSLPIALAAGARHLRRYLAAENSSLSLFWADVRRGLLGSVGIALATVVLVLILLLDIDLGRSGFLPAGTMFVVVGWLGLVAVAIVLFLAARSWTPELGWRSALRAVPVALRDDPVGVLYLAATAAFAGVVTWQLIPLIVPALGCVVFAIVAIPERPRK